MKIYRQSNIFGDKIISSISYDEQEIIRDILYLHTEKKVIDCDPTYSEGNFYLHGIKKPKYKFDKFPQTFDTKQADVSDLPLKNESCNVIMFDPPFVLGGKIKEESSINSSLIARRFTSFQSFDELKELYSGALKEFQRILKTDGIVIFKCQDVVFGSKQYFSHCWVMYEALKYGFYPKDLFILLSKNRMTDKRKQQHARKYHCYFWVFQKQNCKIKY